MSHEVIRVKSVLEAESHLDNITGVVFDLDDTLYSEKSYVRSGFAAVARAFPDMKNVAEELWLAFEAGERAIDVVLGKQAAERALDVYRRHIPSIVLYPGVGDMIARLQRTKRIGIITDGRPEGQRAKIIALGIGDLIKDIIITDELGGPKYRKPNPTAFRILQRKWGVPFGNMAYIGDNVFKDFEAPKELGMHCIWVDNLEGIHRREG